MAAKEPDLGDVLQHGHLGHLLLNGSVRVDLVPKLSPVGGVIHLKATIGHEFPWQRQSGD